MKSLSEKMKRRQLRDRPKTTISIRLPEDVLEDLTEMAPVLGFGSAEALIRAYVSDGMRKHESMMNQPELRVLLETLKLHGIADEVINEVLAETLQKTA